MIRQPSIIALAQVIVPVVLSTLPHEQINQINISNQNPILFPMIIHIVYIHTIYTHLITPPHLTVLLAIYYYNIMVTVLERADKARVWRD